MASSSSFSISSLILEVFYLLLFNFVQVDKYMSNLSSTSKYSILKELFFKDAAFSQLYNFCLSDKYLITLVMNTKV